MSKIHEAEPEGFETFWNVWRPHMRHTDGRGKARDRYRREILERDANPKDMIDGAKAYIRNLLSLPERERSFIPLAASWLHAQSYADWCDKERDFQRLIAEREAQQSAQNVVPMRAPEPSKPIDYDARRRQAREAQARLGLRAAGE